MTAPLEEMPGRLVLFPKERGLEAGLALSLWSRGLVSRGMARLFSKRSETASAD